jgi:hypothetical protein
VIRDPVASLDANRVLELATDRTTGSVDGNEKAASVTPLSTETNPRGDDRDPRWR